MNVLKYIFHGGCLPRRLSTIFPNFSCWATGEIYSKAQPSLAVAGLGNIIMLIIMYQNIHMKIKEKNSKENSNCHIPTQPFKTSLIFAMQPNFYLT